MDIEDCCKENQNLGLEPWEAEWQARELQLYDQGEYETLLMQYCHEGLQTQKRPDGKVEVWICSASTVGETREEAIAKLAAIVKERILRGWLGC